MKTYDIKQVSVDKIVPSEWNANEQDETVFKRLVDEIRHQGFYSPISVVPLQDGTYRVINGEHRWRAAREAGYEEIPCVILEGDRWADTDLQKFVSVRANVLHGQLNPEKFLKLYQEMADKYGDDAVRDLMAFTDKVAFDKLKSNISRNVKKALPKDMQKEYDAAAKEAKTVEDLEKIIQTLFAKYGDTMSLSFMVFTHGKQHHIYVAMDSKLKKDMDKILSYSRSAQLDINEILGPAVKALAKEVAAKTPKDKGPDIEGSDF